MPLTRCFFALCQQIRARALSKAKAALKAPANSVILLAGGTSSDFDLYDTDVLKCEFRQEAFFLYLFGLNEPDCYGALDLETGESLLFVPPTSDDSQRWNGTRRPLSYHTDRYGVSATYLTDDLITELSRRGTKQLFTLYGENTDSDRFTTTIPKAKGLEAFANDSKQLHPFLSELRVHKTPLEIEVLRLGNLISSQAHVYVMRHIREGLSELQLEALFKSWCAFHGGSRHCAYTVSEAQQTADGGRLALLCASLARSCRICQLSAHFRTSALFVAVYSFLFLFFFFLSLLLSVSVVPVLTVPFYTTVTRLVRTSVFCKMVTHVS